MRDYHWVADTNIGGTISYNALTAEIGKPAAKSAIRKLRSLRNKKRLIPSHEHLEVGDIILTAYPRKRNGKDRWDPVHQSQIKQGCEKSVCRWTHAMLYVGELHVIEANKPIKIKTGVDLAPLTRDAHNSEYLVLRYKGADFESRRHDIVRYALMSPYLTPRKYDIKGAIASHFKWRPEGAKLSERIFCSEFVLECFAIMGPFLLEEWIKIQETPGAFFLPAHLATDSRFDQFPMKYFELEG